MTIIGKGSKRQEADSEANDSDSRESSLVLKMQSLFESLPFNCWVKDERGRYMAASRAFGDTIGGTDAVGHTDSELFGEEAAGQARVHEENCVRSKGLIRYEAMQPNGQVHEICLSPIMDADGNAVGIAGYSRDMTALRECEDALRASEDRLRQFQAMARIGSFEIEKDERQFWASDEFFRIFGFDRGDGPKLSYERIRESICPEDLLKSDVAYQALVEKNRAFDIEYRIRRQSDGQERHIHSCASIETTGDGRPRKAGIIRDISDSKLHEEQISYLNAHDLLTGAYNRSSFEKELRRRDNAAGLPLSIIMVDVNGLKLTNDMFGHGEGDKLLVRVATILRECCPKSGSVYRVGGDEFCLLLPRTGGDAARSISAQIVRACELSSGGKCLDLICPSVSLGYATKRESGESMAKVINEAEAFMYKRKLLERKSLRSSVLSSIRTTLFEKSHETEEHAERLVELSKMVGIEMGLADAHLHDLSLLASLHDIGKLSIDEYILCKPGKLTEHEWAEIRRHPEVGYRIAKSSPELISIADYILCHHERWDGKGYPQGLKSRDIPLLSRILAVVDAYDAMTQDRSYRKAAPKDMAIHEIIQNSGTQFDPDVAIVFIKTMQSKLS